MPTTTAYPRVMRPDRFLPQTWFDARLVPAPSPIRGTGLFASAAFDVGEVLLVWGGSVWTRAQLNAGEVPRCSFSFVEGDVLLERRISSVSNA
jgi:hypothetical protein